MPKTPPRGTRILGALTLIENIGLVLITVATVVAIGQEVVLMFQQGKVLLPDILLLFIFLEILTMVGIGEKISFAETVGMLKQLCQ